MASLGCRTWRSLRRTMFVKIAALSALLGLDALLLTYLFATAPDAWPLGVGLLLALVNLVAGIRLGYEAARRFYREVRQLNAYLADQNSELAEANRRLLHEARHRSLHHGAHGAVEQT